MNECRHQNVTVIVEDENRLRCRHCHLTIKASEMTTGYCPECFETDGKKRDDFDEMVSIGRTSTHYRCEDCGVVLKPLGKDNCL